MPAAVRCRDVGGLQAMGAERIPTHGNCSALNEAKQETTESREILIACSLSRFDSSIDHNLFRLTVHVGVGMQLPTVLVPMGVNQISPAQQIGIRQDLAGRALGHQLEGGEK